MSGHSKWATTKHKKAAIDGKRAKIFTKLQKELLVAAKLGDANPDFNPRLRTAVIAARAANMPKDKIDSAIKRAKSSSDGDNFVEIRYEGRAPGGIAVIVEALTDNKNRTASSVRSIFTKCGGTLGETGSVSFMFNRNGVIAYSRDRITLSDDALFELALEVGVDNVEISESWCEMITQPNDFTAVRDALIKTLGDPDEAKITWVPKDLVIVNDIEKADKVQKLIDKLEDDDDVQTVITNADIPDDIIDKLE